MIFNQGVFMKVTLSVTRCLGFVRKTAELERFAFCREKCNFSVLYNQTYIWEITTVRGNIRRLALKTDTSDISAMNKPIL